VIRPKLLSEVPSEREYHPEGRDCVCECRVSHLKPKRPGNGEFGGLCVNNSQVSSPLMRPPVRKTAVYVWKSGFFSPVPCIIWGLERGGLWVCFQKSAWKEVLLTRRCCSESCNWNCTHSQASTHSFAVVPLLPFLESKRRAPSVPCFFWKCVKTGLRVCNRFLHHLLNSYHPDVSAFISEE